ncbi:hypothetical protein D9757_011316, partial [Collybiopsis confluens]
GIVPTDAYPCLPDAEAPTVPSYIVLGANGDSIYNCLMEVIERPDLTGPAYQQNHHQVERQEIIEKAISAWTSRHTSEQVTNAMTASGVPAGRVVTVKDIVEGEQVQARGAIKDVWVDGNGSGRAGWNLKMTGAFPVLEGCETQPKWAGPELGHHTDKVMQAELGLSDGEVEKLWTSGIVG